MSVWTHVVGGIRIDGLPKIIPDHTVATIKKILGPECLYTKWDQTSTLPKGSEGGLQYRVIEYSDGFPWVYVPIWGDLRDFDDVKGIKIWWDELVTLLPKKTFIIRDCVLKVQVEGSEPIVFVEPGDVNSAIEKEKQ